MRSEEIQKKAVRYLKANQMRPVGRVEYDARRKAFLKEIEPAEEKLRAADLDPESIRTIRCQAEKGIEAGRFTNQKKIVLAKLEHAGRPGSLFPPPPIRCGGNGSSPSCSEKSGAEDPGLRFRKEKTGRRSPFRKGNSACCFFRDTLPYLSSGSCFSASIFCR